MDNAPVRDEIEEYVEMLSDVELYNLNKLAVENNYLNVLRVSTREMSKRSDGKGFIKNNETCKELES